MERMPHRRVKLDDSVCL
jgi:hypothetical protein